VDFEIISDITNIETIAAGKGIGDRDRLQKHCGRGRWRKLKEQHAYASLTVCSD
jgi:hypothetical protein